MSSRHRVVWLFCALSLAGACDRSADQETRTPEGAGAQTAAASAGAFVYPESRRGDTVEDYHGVAVADPYRWLEDLDSAETAAWVASQNEVTKGYLNRLKDRETFQRRLEALWDYERYSVPFEEGGRYFVFKNDGLQNQSVLYTMDSLDAEPRVLLDPNKLSADGTVALNGLSISHDGQHLAYALSSAGSDWKTWRIREIATGGDLADVVEWSKFSGASWTHDGAGFFYSRYDAPTEGNEYEGVNREQKLYYHRLGTDQSKDTLVYARPDRPEWGFGASVTDDGRYVVIDVNVGTEQKNAIFFAKIGRSGVAGLDVKPLLPEFDASYGFVGNDKERFWFRTDHSAPRGRLIELRLKSADVERWKELIPEHEDTLRGVSRVGDGFVASYLHDAHSRISMFDLKGDKLRDLALPDIGSASGFGGDPGDSETFFSFQSFTRPPTIYRLDLKDGDSEVYRAPELDYDPSAYVTKQVFYESKDGTKVPMFIVHRADVVPDGTQPTYLYGYGGFNISLTPRFSVPDAVWVEQGGIYAQPNLRGGGEYGEAWHLAGTKTQKQNVFDDFIAAGEWLVAQGIATPKTLGIGGRSNGGLLVGASITQRPDLFGAALAGVGVMDMLRFHLFTIGWAWVSDYGSSDNKEEFEALYAYSPVHNVRPGTAYPATLIYTADHDDRVVPSHSFKFAATLQAGHEGAAPVMIRVDTKAGHGAGKPTRKRIEEWADLWSFLRTNLGG